MIFLRRETAEENVGSNFRRRLYDLIDAINGSATANAVELKFIAAMQDEGFSTIGAREIGNPFVETNSKEVPEIYNGPAEFRRIWHERKYIRHDPTVLAALTTQIPFLWQADQPTKPEGRRILNDAAEFGLYEGVGLPVHSLDQQPACVSMSGSRARDLERADLMTLGLTASHMFVVWSGLVKGAKTVNYAPNLTGRERDVLYCAAAGLSGEGICDRLGIGSASVKSHMKSIRMKLRANSMAHAVAKGIVLGCIAP